ncbi:hypothetical protein LNP00_05030 [Fructobacillus sp. M158]|uniref:DUF7380 domain-containing protein n=1 Tax=Fructobacillus parabroussonetiae TaxID=2713174 RepID=UPI00200B83EF|nr:hypothetical protein [Fructobacillus parabroussonetiae]MCK8617729.1 hypothetical protein [Fructobacillus parabroussonetiae]
MDLYKLINETYNDFIHSNQADIDLNITETLDEDDKNKFFSGTVLRNERSLNLDDLDAHDWDNIKELDFDRLNDIVQARISDSIWVKFSEKEYAKKAIHSYLKIATVLVEKTDKYSFLLPLNRLWNISEKSKELKKVIVDSIRKFENSLFESNFPKYLRLIKLEVD